MCIIVFGTDSPPQPLTQFVPPIKRLVVLANFALVHAGVALATTLITPQAAGKTVEIATEVGLFGTQSLFARGTQTLLRPRGAKQRIADGFAKCPSDDSLRPSLWELVRDFGSQE